MSERDEQIQRLAEAVRATSACDAAVIAERMYAAGAGREGNQGRWCMKRISAVIAVLVTFCTTGPDPCAPVAVDYTDHGQAGSEVQCVPPNCEDSCYAS